MLKYNINITKFEIVDKAFSYKKANIVGTLIMIPVFIISFIIYSSIYSGNAWNYNSKFIFLIFMLGIIIHEFIHAFTWNLFSKHKWKHIKFGIDKKSCCPYTHCNEILPINCYRIGVIAPFLLTGVLPFILGLKLQNTTIIYTSILLMCCSSGDFMILYTIYKEKNLHLL
ncbi:hypothetical protein UT300005_20530 [Clostridium sp. CTA-5]